MTRGYRRSALLLLTGVCVGIVGASSLSSGCGNGRSVPNELEGSTGHLSREITVGDRVVRLSVPATYHESEGPMPVILAYHDNGMSAQDMEAATRLSDQGSNNEYIVAYPQARNDKSSPDSATSPTSDFTFASDVLDHLSNSLCIDTDRIYATGLGTGAQFVHLLACHPELSARIAAYAMVNGVFPTPDPSTMDMNHPDAKFWTECSPAKNQTRVLSVHGQDNDVYPYFATSNKSIDEELDAEAAEEIESTTSSTQQSIVTWLVEWAIRNDCGSSFALPLELSSPHPYAGSHLTRLQRGSLVEGYATSDPSDESVIRAAYRCWARSEYEITGVAEKLVRKYDGLANIVPFDDIKTKEGMDRFVIQRVDEIVGRANRALKELQSWGEDEASEEEKKATLEFSEKGADLIAHYAVQGAGHGWLRVEKGCDEKEWKPIDHSTDPAEIASCTTTFDTTSQVLSFFNPLRLSDTVPVDEPEEANVEEMMASLDGEGIDELLKYMSEHIRVKDQMKEHLLGQIGVQDESAKTRMEDRKKVRERFAEMQRKKNEEYLANQAVGGEKEMVRDEL